MFVRYGLLVLSVFSMLLTPGCGPKTPAVSEESTQAVFKAIADGNAAAVDQLLKKEPAVVHAVVGDAQHGSIASVTMGDTPLHVAAHSDDRESIVQALLKGHADVNAKNDDGQTPLHCACWWEAPRVACLLVASKADIKATDKQGRTPLHSLADNEPFTGADGTTDHRPELAAFLVSKGADVNAKDKSGATPLHLAAMQHHAGMVKFLISKGADVNAKTTSPMTMTSISLNPGASSTNESTIPAGASPMSITSDAAIKDILKKHGGKQ